MSMMLRRISAFVSAALLVALAGSAGASTFEPLKSPFRFKLAAFPTQTINAAGTGTATLSDDGFGGHLVNDTASIWATSAFGIGTSFLTGVPLITNIKLTASNRSGLVGDGFSTPAFVADANTNPAITGFGGIEPLSGQVLVSAFNGALQLPVPINFIGGMGGGMGTAATLGLTITATGGPFVTAPVTITDITTNIVSIPGRGGVTGVQFTLDPTTGETVMTFSTMGGFVSLNGGNPLEASTVIISGTNTLASASVDGMVTLVSPVRVDTGSVAGKVPASATKKFTFAPEPGTLLLLVAGAAGLVVVGRARMRK